MGLTTTKRKKTKKYERFKPQQEHIGGQELPEFAPILQINPIPFNAKIICFEASRTNAAITLYTIPAEKKFWLTGANLQAISVTTAGSGQHARLFYVSAKFGSGIFGYLGVPAAANLTEALAMQFNPPIILEAGDYIRLESEDASVIAKASIFGYEIDM